VAEAYLRLTSGHPISWESRAHFLSAAGRVTRQILVDHVRAKKAVKRGGNWQRLELIDSMATAEQNPSRLLAIDEALSRLAVIDGRAAQVVELRFFAGLSTEETADTLAVSPKTVKRDWAFARVWLEQALRSA
jgi:RNA polymerase sigma factor (TIGR02999 family)